jgi:hypothetical protein
LLDRTGFGVGPVRLIAADDGALVTEDILARSVSFIPTAGARLE